MFFRKQRPAGNDNVQERVEVTVVGAGTEIEGNIASDGEVRIEGSVRGLVQAQVCIVATGGRVTGEISAETVEIHGRVHGPIRAGHVHLQTGADVEGDIASATIAIDTGARLSGAVWRGSAPSAAPAALPAPGQSASHSLFSSDSLWASRQEDGYRPLAAVRPRNR